LIVFFFQAEDGIRDGHVTGVQTCALPICSSSSPERRASLRRGGATSGPGRTSRRWQGRERSHLAWARASSRGARSTGSAAAVGRSEERRVGKEGRWGWSQDDQ